MRNASVGFPSAEDDTDQDEVATLPAPPDLEESARGGAHVDEPVAIPRPSDIRRIIRELAERVDVETKRR